MRFKVFIICVIFENGIEMLKEYFEVEVWFEECEIFREVLFKKVRDVDVLVIMLSERIDSEVFDVVLRLRIVVNYVVGYDNIDVEEVMRRGIYVINMFDVLIDVIVDFVWMFFLVMVRRLIEVDYFICFGEWKRRGIVWYLCWFFGYDVYGKMIGIVGFGRIG